MISCKEYVEIEKMKLKEKLEKIGKVPYLAIVKTCNNVASDAYVKGKVKDAEDIGIRTKVYTFNATNENINEFKLFIKNLCDSNNYNGVIIQKPLSKHFLPYEDEIDNLIPCNKDVDGLARDSLFTPATARGIIDWLKVNNIDLCGKNVTIIGRSKLVGLPLAKLMIKANATVTICHSKTKELKEHTNRADIIISAVGKPCYLDSQYFNKYKQQLVIDVGISREHGKLVGDVDSDVINIVEYLTPVPGGVGLLTRIALMKNVFETTVKM